jgi:homopolymeric O-antigen transport system ATP-binding protein
MSRPVIQVEALSKSYRIGERQQAYSTLRDSITRTLKTLLRRKKARQNQSDDDRTLWALRDVSFEVQPGEVVGVIGRNGAGKSTLLKVLSRITEPTSGRADLHGRLGSLLEVGTGFHPELTGRENVYLNGAIMGMKRAHLNRCFDAIVDFAGVERFIDTPVKYYSSGMYMRLAFAVAAHLEPEILLIDEVLAVGDIAFQKKCLGRMGEVARDGRTVLFVSHNMGAIRSLCTRGLVLHQGGVAEFGDISKAINKYYTLASEEKDVEQAIDRSGFGRIWLASHESGTIDHGEPFEVETTIRMANEAAGFTLVCGLEDMNQRSVCHLREDSSSLSDTKRWHGSYRLRVKFPTLWLEPGMYSLYFKLLLWGDSGSGKHVSDMLHLDVGGASSGWGAALSPGVEWSLRSSEKEPQPEFEMTRLAGPTA